MRGCAVLLLLLSLGCANPMVDKRIQTKKIVLAEVEKQLRDLEAQLPVVEERRARVDKLLKENAALTEEINALRKKKGLPPR